MVDTPWHRGREKSKSKLQEERTARMPGARPQVNSGRIWNSLRDNTLRSFIGIFLIDNKTTENPNRESYKLERSKWLELKRDANRTPPGCLPAYQVDLKEVQLFVFEVDTWDEIVKYVLALEDQLERAVEKLEEATRKTSQMSRVPEDD